MVQTETLLRLAQLGFAHRHWYADARRAIAATCAEHGWDVSRFAQVMALTSPRVQVSRNVTVTLHYMHKGELPKGTMRSTRKAVSNWEQGKGIAGRKTGPFADALLGNPDALVLDVWMAYALGVDQRVVTRIDVAQAATRRVRRIAGVLDCTIAEAQASIWCGMILTANRIPARFEIAADGKWGLNTKASRLMFGGL